MGIFGKLLGGEKNKYPPLDPSAPGANKFTAHKQTIEPFVKKVNDNLEVVPVDSAVYIFVGKPPGMFGVVWFDRGDSKEHSFKSLMQEKGLQQTQVQLFSDELRDAYTRHQGAPRYSAEIASKTVTVTVDEGLANEVHNIIEKVMGRK